MRTVQGNGWVMAHRVDVDELAAALDDLLHRACVLHHFERGDVQRVHDGLRISCILRGDSTLAEGVAKGGLGCAQTRAGGGSWRWAVGLRGSHLRAPGRLSPSIGRRGRSTTQNMYMSCEINFSGRRRAGF